MLLLLVSNFAAYKQFLNILRHFKWYLSRFEEIPLKYQCRNQRFVLTLGLDAVCLGLNHGRS